MTMADHAIIGLVADLGGTNARFAIAEIAASASARPDIALRHIRSLAAADYRTVAEAAADYLTSTGLDAPPDFAVAACAGPIIDGAVAFTNIAWSATETDLASALNIPRVRLINDLAAVAWAATILPAGSLRRIGTTPDAAKPATCAILSAGTGCNASAYIPNPTGGVVLVGEYGHSSYAPTDALEAEIWQHLHAQFGVVSIERLLSGPGLLNIYQALCAIEGAAIEHDTPAQVAAAARAPVSEPIAMRSVARLCAIAGSVAGDVALAYGATGGVFLAGGVAAKLLTPEHDASFRIRFTEKGRFGPYLAAIPTQVIEDTDCALLGAARAIASLTVATASRSR
jgi:glucokinase